jgi:ribosomal protein S18 acetylase RimI-like enzyme
MHVAILRTSDAMQYRELMLEAYELAADAFTSTAAERRTEPESFWIKRIADSSGAGVAFGAFDGPHLIGTVALEFSKKPKTRHKATVIGMYVRPHARRVGAGRALLEAAIEHAKAREGTLLLTLTATEGNTRAIELYARAGFERFGTEPLAVLTSTGFKAKVHMWLPLRSDVPEA